MARQILQQCLECKQYCLDITCPNCGGKAQAAAPLRWSPEDPRANLRRKLHKVSEEGWSESLPELNHSSEE